MSFESVASFCRVANFAANCERFGIQFSVYWPKIKCWSLHGGVKVNLNFSFKCNGMFMVPHKQLLCIEVGLVGPYPLKRLIKIFTDARDRGFSRIFSL